MVYGSRICDSSDSPEKRRPNDATGAGAGGVVQRRNGKSMGTGFDKDKDERLAAVTAFEDKASVVGVAIYRYNGGTAKIQISRFLKNPREGKPGFTKLGRISYEEFVGIARAVKHLKEAGTL